MAETEVKEPTNIEKELAILNERLSRLEELYKKGEIEEYAYKKLKEEYESRKIELEKRKKEEIGKLTPERITTLPFTKAKLSRKGSIGIGAFVTLIINLIVVFVLDVFPFRGSWFLYWLISFFRSLVGGLAGGFIVKGAKRGAIAGFLGTLGFEFAIYTIDCIIDCIIYRIPVLELLKWTLWGLIHLSSFLIPTVTGGIIGGIIGGYLSRR